MFLSKEKKIAYKESYLKPRLITISEFNKNSKREKALLKISKKHESPLDG